MSCRSPTTSRGSEKNDFRHAVQVCLAESEQFAVVEYAATEVTLRLTDLIDCQRGLCCALRQRCIIADFRAERLVEPRAYRHVAHDVQRPEAPDHVRVIIIAGINNRCDGIFHLHDSHSDIRDPVVVIRIDKFAMEVR